MEQNYKEKYEQALKRAKAMINVANNQEETYNCAITIFPELCESEDEKVRKTLIRVLNENVGNGIEKYGAKLEDALAWLEKQKQEPMKISIWKHWKDGICGNGEGKLIYLIKDGDYYSLSSSLGFECDYIELSDLDNLMLEKQGEQKPAWSEEELTDFEKSLKHVMEETLECGDIHNLKADADLLLRLVKLTDGDMKEALRTEYEKGRADAIAEMQKEWSEEDENYKDALIGLITEIKNQPLKRLEDWDAYISWLKSLKDRVQPKQEWSEEDDMMIEETLYFLREYQQSNRCKDENGMQNSVSCEKWLKSLKERYTWKPSDEQIEALDFAADCIVPAEFCFKRKELKGLLEQLKKLKGH